MESPDRSQFEIILAELFGAMDKPLTEAKREGFWRGLAKMSLIEFARCRDLLLEELADGEPRKSFSVSDIWGAKSRLRARVAAPPPAEPHWDGDRWDLAANRHLMAYLMRRVMAHQARYDAAATAHLVEAKKLWAQDMREDEENREVDVESQRAMWGYRIAAAERHIAERAAA